MDDDQVERAVLAKGLDVAPRVTREHIDAMMARVVYIGGRVGQTTSTIVHAFLDGTFLLASGHSACVSPENFDADLGEQMARNQAEIRARDQLWLLEGYALRSKLAGPTVTDEMVSRFLSWPIPQDFGPDCHVRFDKDAAQNGSWPVGTNLFHAGQVRDMLQHALGG